MCENVEALQRLLDFIKRVVYGIQQQDGVTVTYSACVYRQVARECHSDPQESPSAGAESRTQEIQAVCGLHQTSRHRLLQTLRWTRSAVEHEDIARPRRLRGHRLVRLPALDERTARD